MANGKKLIIVYFQSIKGTASDPFYETQENHNLIGVANVFLEVLFHDVTLDYHTPIISQQGEVAGRLQVELSRVNGRFPQDRVCEAASECSADSTDSAEEDAAGTNTILCKVRLHFLEPFRLVHN